MPSKALKVATFGDYNPGKVEYFAVNSVPRGWLKCNGQAVSRAVYSDLFAKIGTTYGAGNGATTFNVPDLRGEFIRGVDDGRGVDSGRVFGSAQTDGLKSHTHTTTHVGSVGAGSDYLAWTTGDGGEPLNPNRFSGSTGGAETRPRNVALLPCIKF